MPTILFCPGCGVAGRSAYLHRGRPQEETAIVGDHRVNDAINVPQVRLVDDDGSQVGVVSTRDALDRAREKGLDLVEVAPQGEPPVCRIMDYGKFRFESRKQQKKPGKKPSRAGQVKEVKFRPRTDDHDIAYKVKNLLKFLGQGQKVKVTLSFRGRERSRMQMYADAFMPKVLDQIGEEGIIEQQPRHEGNTVSMMIAPKPKK